MRTWMIAVLGSVLASGCSKGDECQQFADKSMPIIEKMMKDAGQPISAGDKAKFIDMCRKDEGGKAKKDPVFRCVLDAPDQAAVATCYGTAFGDYMKKGKKTEAQLQLTKLGKNLKVEYMTTDAYPIGKAGPTPPTGCCGQDKNKCAVVQDWATDKVWTALDFQIDEPGLFQYTYESVDGKTAKATAVGDLDCDGTTITYTLDMTVDAGNPTLKITEPPANTD